MKSEDAVVRLGLTLSIISLVITCGVLIHLAVSGNSSADVRCCVELKRDIFERMDNYDKEMTALQASVDTRFLNMNRRVDTSQAAILVLSKLIEEKKVKPQKAKPKKPSPIPKKQCVKR